jgi:hypothetical protein
MDLYSQWKCPQMMSPLGGARAGSWTQEGVKVHQAESSRRGCHWSKTNNENLSMSVNVSFAFEIFIDFCTLIGAFLTNLPDLNP